MSGISYPPPSENLPIFDSSVFQPTEAAIDSQTGLNYFLAFPNAQGTENLQAINVNGLASFNASANTNNSLIFKTPTGTDPSNNTTTLQQIYTGALQPKYLQFLSSVAGGGLRFADPTANAFILSANGTGLEINKGLTIGALSNANSVGLIANGTNNNQLDVSGNVNITPTQTYPLANSQNLATISYVNGAVGGSSILGTNNVWTGTNAFNTSTPTTSVAQTYPQSTSTTRFSTIGYVNSALSSIPSSNNYSVTFTDLTLVTGDTVWTAILVPPSTGFPNSFYYYYNSNSQSSTITIPAQTKTVTSNQTSFSGFGMATRQNYVFQGTTNIAYVFTSVSTTGMPTGSTFNFNTPPSTQPASPTIGVNVNTIGFNDNGTYYAAGTTLTMYIYRF